MDICAAGQTVIQTDTHIQKIKAVTGKRRQTGATAATKTHAWNRGEIIA